MLSFSGGCGLWAGVGSCGCGLWAGVGLCRRGLWAGVGSCGPWSELTVRIVVPFLPHSTYVRNDGFFETSWLDEEEVDGPLLSVANNTLEVVVDLVAFVVDCKLRPSVFYNVIDSSLDKCVCASSFCCLLYGISPCL